MMVLLVQNEGLRRGLKRSIPWHIYTYIRTYIQGWAYDPVMSLPNFAALGEEGNARGHAQMAGAKTRSQQAVHQIASFKMGSKKYDRGECDDATCLAMRTAKAAAVNAHEQAEANGLPVMSCWMTAEEMYIKVFNSEMVKGEVRAGPTASTTPKDQASTTKEEQGSNAQSTKGPKGLAHAREAKPSLQTAEPEKSTKLWRRRLFIPQRFERRDKILHKKMSRFGKVTGIEINNQGKVIDFEFSLCGGPSPLRHNDDGPLLLPGKERLLQPWGG